MISCLFLGVCVVVEGYAYFGMYTTPGIVVKIRCYADGSLPVRVSALTIPDGQGINLHRSVIDASFQIGYWATFDDPGQVSTIYPNYLMWI